MIDEKQQNSKQNDDNDDLIYDEKRHNLYGNSILHKIPVFVKVAGIKIWAAGALCYFIHIGSGLLNPLDLLVIDILVLTLVIEYLINNIIFWLETDRQPTRHYAFYEKRSQVSLFINFFYATFMMILIFISYMIIGYLVNKIGIDLIGDIDFGSSPLVFGLLFFGYDYLIVKLKNIIKGKKKREDKIND